MSTQQERAFEAWWDDPPDDGPTPEGPISKASARWIWQSAIAAHPDAIDAKRYRKLRAARAQENEPALGLEPMTEDECDALIDSVQETKN